MNLLKKTILIVLSIFSFSAIAQSEADEKGFYFEGGLSSLSLKYGNYSSNLGTTYAIYGGYNINKYLAAEVMTAHSSTADYSTTLTFGGAFVKPKYPINETFEIFGRVGYNNMTLSTSYGGSLSKTFTAFGGGLTAYITSDKKQFVSADYMRWGAANGYTLAGPAITYGYKF